MENYDQTLMEFTEQYYKATGLFPTSQMQRMFFDIFENVSGLEFYCEIDYYDYSIFAKDDVVYCNVEGLGHPLKFKLTYVKGLFPKNLLREPIIHINDLARKLPGIFDNPEIDEIELIWDADAALSPMYACYGIAPEFEDSEYISFGHLIRKAIDMANISDSAIYNTAFVSRQTFNNIINDYVLRPDKRISLALLVALKIPAIEFSAYMKAAGHYFPSNTDFDRIVYQQVESGNYDIMKINEALFEANIYTLLGSGRRKDVENKE